MRHDVVEGLLVYQYIHELSFCRLEVGGLKWKMAMAKDQNISPCSDSELGEDAFVDGSASLQLRRYDCVRVGKRPPRSHHLIDLGVGGTVREPVRCVNVGHPSGRVCRIVVVNGDRQLDHTRVVDFDGVQ